MKKILLFLLFFAFAKAEAQTKLITGTVKDTGGAIPGVSIVVEGTGTATQTDKDGKFRVQAAPGTTLIVTSIGYSTVRMPVTTGSVYNITLVNEENKLNEVVVTALGISRQKKSLGYASQELSGESLNQVPTSNITNSLSGKAAGVQVQRNNNFGGSTNIVIRGNTSLTGNNQALFVVDGVPVSNSTFNTADQQGAGGGYDFGNLASDINPDDVESMNVLKGAAATALYGSRAANGAIIITMKKGAGKGKPVIELSSGVTIGVIDKSTWPKFQQEYGSGYEKIYGPNRDQFFNSQDVNGDGVLDLVPAFNAYGSFGAAYDPSLLVYQWNAFDPALATYHVATPWVAPKNGPDAFFETPVTNTNSISMAGSTDNGGNYRFSYTNVNQKGLLPNSDIKRNNFSMSNTFKINDRLTVNGSGNFSKADVTGRNLTGNESGSGGGNYSAIVRQWWQNNVDLGQLKDAYFSTGRNITNFIGGTIDNPYWTRYENYESDTRTRFYGNLGLKYKLTDWLTADGRVSVDTYSYLQEDRTNTGTTGQVGRYTRQDIDFMESNYDLMLNFNKNITKKLNISGVVGTNIRRNDLRTVFMETNGGLIVPGLFSVSNSVSAPAAPIEVAEKLGVDGIYGLVSLGYNDTYFLDVTGRSDHASTLPENNSTFFYPSVAASFIFSNLLKSDFINFGKLRLNYAEVGSSAPANRLTDILQKPTPFGSVPLYAVNTTKNNANLLPESTQSYEAGVEMSFLKRRLGLDVSVYKTNTKDQIIPVEVSSTTGYTSKYVNAGEVQNKGVEVVLSGTPVTSKDFSWDVKVNWAKNKNTVVSLFEGVDNLQLGSFRGTVTLNATVGEAYGTLKGADFIYLNGARVINQTTGEYAKTSTFNNVIGDVNPDWKGGVSNSFRYKNLSLSFLVDMQKGGDIFSSDMAQGYRSGLYENTVGLNDLGNPMRNSLADGGGIILAGVAPDGSPNAVRTRMDTYNNALGIVKGPQALYIYDATYIKLREVAITYKVNPAFLKKIRVRGLSISAVGSNLWIIHKNLPYADPESGLSAGNIQGYQLGPLPTTRDFGLNVKLQF